MPAWKLLIEYDGTRYAGWQMQPHARTIQGELLKAAETLLQIKVELVGAGRTDAGVHALGQVAHLKTKQSCASLSSRQLQFGLNDALPHDINVLHAHTAPASFHARHDALMRSYIYQISTRRTAFGKPYVWWVKDRLNVAAMTEASAALRGRHDFRSFCEAREDSSSTLVQVADAQLKAKGDLLLFRVSASHFLWKMVRRVVGALVEVGRGKLTVPDFKQLLTHQSGAPAAWTAPPSGLFLEKVEYPGDGKTPVGLNPVFAIGSKP